MLREEGVVLGKVSLFLRRPRQRWPPFPSRFYHGAWKCHIHFVNMKTTHGEGNCISFLGAAVTKYQKLGGFKQWEFLMSQFWRLAVRNQGAGRTMLPLKAPSDSPCLF